MDSVAESSPPPSLRQKRRKRGLSLFWRTFFLVSALLLCSVLAWLQSFRALDYEPKQLSAAKQAASLVSLTRAALEGADAITRISLIKNLRERENLHIVAREPDDKFTPYDTDAQNKNIQQEIVSRLGDRTTVASAVNDTKGFWIGFRIGQDGYWILIDPLRVGLGGGGTWFIWLAAALALSLFGSVLIAGLINRPLKNLSFATSRLREGDYLASRLDESAMTSEIREVNAGFNRMAEQLAKIEQDRAVMLAGISHDLRTPLARLRLEAEMSVSDESALQNMAADINQLDAVIDKFLEYAKSDSTQLVPINVHEVMQSCIAYQRKNKDKNLKIAAEGSKTLCVMADQVELSRVFNNLFENARKYGQSLDGTTFLEINVSHQNNLVFIKFRDYGKGVPQAMLRQLTQPFFRGNAARTHATGAGLGLAIVERAIARMGGTFQLANALDGGLICRIQLSMADPQPGHQPNRSSSQRTSSSA